jgi:hypothetical protein
MLGFGVGTRGVFNNAWYFERRLVMQWERRVHFSVRERHVVFGFGSLWKTDCKMFHGLSLAVTWARHIITKRVSVGVNELVAIDVSYRNRFGMLHVV